VRKAFTLTPERIRRVAEMSGRGISQADIARSLGTTSATVRKALRTPGAAEIAAQVQVETDPGAVDVLRALLQDPKPEIRLAAARALLTRDARDAEDAPPADTGPRITVIHALPPDSSAKPVSTTGNDARPASGRVAAEDPDGLSDGGTSPPSLAVVSP
jgi:predicted transcriptional regulator